MSYDKEFNINNINDEGVTSEEQFTDEEKATQINDPADDPIFNITMDDKSAGKKLTNKQRMFAQYFVATGEVARSAELAGYGDGNKKAIRTIAQALKHNPDINAYVAELMQKKLESKGYSKDQLVDTLLTIANHNVKDYMDISKETKTSKNGNEYDVVNIDLKDFKEIDMIKALDDYGLPLEDSQGNPIYVDSGKTKAIKSIKMSDSGKVIVEFYDKMQAVDRLTKMMGIDGKQQIEINSHVKVEETKQSLMDKLMKKFGNEPEVEVPAEENEWYKQQQADKQVAEQIEQGEEGDING